jgi:NADPH:quinone reductase-like Zn-dependent oxidoreductase
MKRWVLKAGATDSNDLVLEDVPLPEPGPNEVRVRVHAVSLNYRDQLVLKDTSGRLRLPGRDLVPVSDGAGEIDAVGSDVAEWRVGERVASLYFRDRLHGQSHANMGYGLGSADEDGMLAEFVVLPAKRVTRVPESLNFAEAATLPCAALTAWNALQGPSPIGPGNKVLVLGTGGVSLFALTFARALGAEVFATTSQDSKKQRLAELGVREILNYCDNPEWGQTVYEHTTGMDRVVNPAGAGSINQSLAAVRYGGEVAIMGLMTFGEAINSPVLMAKEAIIRGIAVGSGDDFSAVSRLIDTNQIKPLIDQIFSFQDTREAYRRQVSSNVFGKLVITMD